MLFENHQSLVNRAAFKTSLVSDNIEFLNTNYTDLQLKNTISLRINQVALRFTVDISSISTWKSLSNNIF